MTEGNGELVARALKHPTRRALVSALWVSSEPLTAQTFRDEFSDRSEPLSAISYHAGVLQSGDVIEVSTRNGGWQFVLGGDNAAEAVRLLGLSDIGAQGEG